MLRPLRVGDPAICRCSCDGKPCVSGVILKKEDEKKDSSNIKVLIENRLVALVGDRPYSCFGCGCLGCPEINKILTGSKSVIINGLPVAHEKSTITPPCIQCKSLAKFVYVGI